MIVTKSYVEYHIRNAIGNDFGKNVISLFVSFKIERLIFKIFVYTNSY